MVIPMFSLLWNKMEAVRKNWPPFDSSTRSRFWSRQYFPDHIAPNRSHFGTSLNVRRILTRDNITAITVHFPITNHPWRQHSVKSICTSIILKYCQKDRNSFGQHLTLSWKHAARVLKLASQSTEEIDHLTCLTSYLQVDLCNHRYTHVYHSTLGSFHMPSVTIVCLVT